MTCPDDTFIKRTYRVRLRPTPAQASLLRRIFGARRAVWNWAVSEQKAARANKEKLPGHKALSAAFTKRRNAEETKWLSELPREPFDQTLRDLDSAWTRYFKGQNCEPTSKRFGSVNSARFKLDQRREQVTRGERQGEVQIDGVGRVRFRRTESMVGRLRSVTVTLDSAGRWHASFTADRVPAPVASPAPRAAIGIDLGLKDTAVLSDGTRVAAARAAATKRKRLRRYLRAYNRGLKAQLQALGLDPRKPIPKGTRVPASNRMRRRQQAIGRLHAKVADARRDHQHQLTVHAVRVAEVICIEDLAVHAMGKSLNRGFRRSVADAGLGEIRRQLKYKAAWAGRTLSVVDRWYPSSKTCSACRAVNSELKLKERRWTCEACGTKHDRDLNAARNIEREGLKLLAQSTCPDGPTPRFGGSKRVEREPGATSKSSLVGQPPVGKRELSYRGATRRTPARVKHDVSP